MALRSDTLLYRSSFFHKSNVYKLTTHVENNVQNCRKHFIAFQQLNLLFSFRRIYIGQ